MNQCKKCNTDIQPTGKRGRPAKVCPTCKALPKAPRAKKTAVAPAVVAETPVAEPVVAPAVDPVTNQ